MGDDRAEAASRECREVIGELGIETSEWGLEQEPAAACGSLGDELELRVAQRARVTSVELTAGAHTHPDTVVIEQRSQRVDALRDRRDLERPVAIHVRGDRDVADTFGGESSRVGDGSGVVAGTIVHPWEQVEVQIQI